MDCSGSAVQDILQALVAGGGHSGRGCNGIYRHAFASSEVMGAGSKLQCRDVENSAGRTASKVRRERQGVPKGWAGAQKGQGRPDTELWNVRVVSERGGGFSDCWREQHYLFT